VEPLTTISVQKQARESLCRCILSRPISTCLSCSQHPHVKKLVSGPPKIPPLRRSLRYTSTPDPIAPLITHVSTSLVTHTLCKILNIVDASPGYSSAFQITGKRNQYKPPYLSFQSMMYKPWITSAQRTPPRARPNRFSSQKYAAPLLGART